jgi:hypothetical protein
MERRPGSEDSDRPAGQDRDTVGPDPTLEPRDPEQASAEADPVQGWQEGEPTDPELEPDDGYHPDDNAGPKYEDPDPVDEPLLAREEGLSPDEEEELNAESELP